MTPGAGGEGRHLPAGEAAALLRAILAGEHGLRLTGRRPFVSVAVGEWGVAAGDAEIVFFVDSASLDHVVRVRMADGRQAGFGDWLEHDGHNPLELIDENERLELERLLYAVH